MKRIITIVGVLFAFILLLLLAINPTFGSSSASSCGDSALGKNEVSLSLLRGQTLKKARSSGAAIDCGFSGQVEVDVTYVLRLR